MRSDLPRLLVSNREAGGKVVGSVAFPERNCAAGRLRLECANVAVRSVAFPNRNGTARPA